MRIGIDVGGTFTDGVVYDNGKIRGFIKHPTDDTNLKKCLMDVLDKLLEYAEKDKIERIVISTTLVTNLIATKRGERTALILIPGHGLPHNAYRICDDTYFLSGSIDFRGREIEALDKNEVINCIEEIRKKGIKRVAVAGKFANRNNSQEKMIYELFTQSYPECSVSISSEVANQLNFPRRAVTTYYTAMTLKEWHSFADEIEKGIRERDITAKIDILKADGGTIPLINSKDAPCETIFSGPAASTMGGAALTMDSKNSVVVDIGGTTSDISLLIEGKPLYASKGAVIDGKYTQINSFAVNSVALGGDSSLYLDVNHVNVGSYRQGASACFGGEIPTVTDAFNYYYDLKIGKPDLSAAALKSLADRSGLEIRELSAKVVELVTDRLVSSIKSMFKEWENEPAYKVWEVVNKRKFELHQIIGIGAAAPAIIPVLANKLNVPYLVHDYSPIANALGASVVRPTLAVSLHVDTQRGIYTVDPGGITKDIAEPGSFQLADAKEIALKYLNIICTQRGIQDYAADYDFFLEEQFNLIRGWDRIGKMFDVGVQISPGFIHEYKGVKI